MTLQIYSYPFSQFTRIEFSLEQASLVELEVYNSQRQREAILVREVLQAGKHSAIFNSTDYESGFYIVRLTVGGVTELKQIELLKKF